MIGIITIITLVTTLLLSLGIGQIIARILRIPTVRGDFNNIVLAVGLGSIAWMTFILGITIGLNNWVFIGMAMVFGIITWNEAKNFISRCFRTRERHHLSFYLLAEEKIVLVLASILIGMIVIQALTPPWDYDGLMYHLQGPHLFLLAGRVAPLPENWLTFYPFLVEMLFSIGLSFGSDTFAKLINVVFTVQLVIATYWAAARFIGRKYAWLAAAILIGIPIFPIWASFAYSDMAWALYEFLAVYVVLIWDEQRFGFGDHNDDSDRRNHSPDWRILVLAGCLMGFALGTKYMALGGAAVLGFLIFWQRRMEGWRSATRNVIIFCLTTFVVASPWYLKNYFWTGNPIYPFFFSPGGDVGERVMLWTEYMNGFGAPRTLLGYLSLPVIIYTQHYRFGTFLGSIEIPSILFPLAFFYPLTRRTAVLNALAIWSLMRFGVWMVGAQQTRFLLPLFPALSILAAYVLVNLVARLNGVAGRVLVRGLGFGVLAIALVYSLLFFMDVRPLKVLIGKETRQDFLRRQLQVYPFQEYIQTNLSVEDSVWMLWDGRGYYCDDRCVPDIDQSQWTQIAMQSWDVEQVADELNNRGATHLLISKQDANFIARFDDSGLQVKAQFFLEKEFLPECSRTLVKNEYYNLVELTCR